VATRDALDAHRRAGLRELAGRHGLRKSAKTAYRNGLQPVHVRHGQMPILALEKRHFDELVADLMAGGAVPVHVKECRGVRGRYRQPWEATTINPMLNYLESRCYWATACAKAGVKRIRLHGARHTCGTHAPGAQRAGGDHQGMARARRHAFTMRIYVHNQPAKLVLAAESISSWTRRKKSAL
jgi:hypothetical protein